MSDLFASVKSWFNQSHEIGLRVGELGKGLEEPERRMLHSIPSHSRILDIGCAAGRVSFALAQEGHAVTGIDVAEKLIGEAQKTARRRGIEITFQVCDPLKLPFSDGSFDVALLLKTYCYVPGRKSRIEWIDEISRVVRPGGQLYLSQYIIDDMLGSYEPIQEDNRNRFPSMSEQLEEGDNFSMPVENSEEVGYVHHFMEADLLDEIKSSRLEVVHTFREETICYCSLKR